MNKIKTFVLSLPISFMALNAATCANLWLNNKSLTRQETCEYTKTLIDKTSDFGGYVFPFLKIYAKSYYTDNCHGDIYASAPKF